MNSLPLCVRCCRLMEWEPDALSADCVDCEAEDIAEEARALELEERGLTLREVHMARTPLAPVCSACGSEKQPGEEVWFCRHCDDGPHEAGESNGVGALT